MPRARNHRLFTWKGEVERPACPASSEEGRGLSSLPSLSQVPVGADPGRGGSGQPPQPPPFPTFAPRRPRGRDALSLAAVFSWTRRSGGGGRTGHTQRAVRPLWSPGPRRRPPSLGVLLPPPSFTHLPPGRGGCRPAGDRWPPPPLRAESGVSRRPRAEPGRGGVPAAGGAPGRVTPGAAAASYKGQIHVTFPQRGGGRAGSRRSPTATGRSGDLTLKRKASRLLENIKLHHGTLTNNQDHLKLLEGDKVFLFLVSGCLSVGFFLNAGSHQLHAMHVENHQFRFVAQLGDELSANLS